MVDVMLFHNTKNPLNTVTGNFFTNAKLLKFTLFGGCC